MTNIVLTKNDDCTTQRTVVGILVPTLFTFATQGTTNGSTSTATIRFAGSLVAILNNTNTTYVAHSPGDYTLEISGTCSGSTICISEDLIKEHNSDDILATSLDILNAIETLNESDPLTVCDFNNPDVKLIAHPRYQAGVFQGWFNDGGTEIFEGSDFVICDPDTALTPGTIQILALADTENFVIPANFYTATICVTAGDVDITIDGDLINVVAPGCRTFGNDTGREHTSAITINAHGVVDVNWEPTV